MSNSATASSSAAAGRVQAVARQVRANKTYKYTREGGAFTPEQRDFYEENGYIVIKGLVKPDKIEQYRRRFRTLCENPSERPVSMTVMRDVALAKKGVSENSEQVITKVQDFQDDPELFDYCQDPEILKYVESVTGPRIVASHTMLINKPTDPGQGTSRHPLHQDHLYFPFRPFEGVIAAWCALEKVTRDNGCLIAVPGSHRTELLEHGYPDWEGGANKAYVGIMGVTPDVKYVHLPMEAGDVVFFTSLIWHGSGRNQTPNFRKAICCHFVSGDCRFINVKGTEQEELEAEIKEMMTGKLQRRGVEVTEELLSTFNFSDVWAMKSRVVRGDQMILPAEE